MSCLSRSSIGMISSKAFGGVLFINVPGRAFMSVCGAASAFVKGRIIPMVNNVSDRGVESENVLWP